MDEIVIVGQGRHLDLWRGVDCEGEILEMLVQSKRDKGAGLRLMRILLKKKGFGPKVLVTDKLRSYGIAHQALGLWARRDQGGRQNNRAENSHQPTRRRERQMQRFKSAEQAQYFLSAHAFIHGHFHPRRHLLARNSYRAIRAETFNIWQQETCAQQVA